MAGVVGNPMPAFLRKKCISVPIWPCTTRAHSWPWELLTWWPTLQTHWAWAAAVFFISEDMMWWKAHPGSQTSVLVSLCHQFEFEMGRRIMLAPWQFTVCWLTHALFCWLTHALFCWGILRVPLLCHTPSSFLFFPWLPFKGSRWDVGFVVLNTSRCLVLDSRCPHMFLTLSLGRQC